jgi:phosphatidate cytidylyltransferase
MLHWRLLLGTIFIAALIGLCWVDHLSSPPGVVLLPLAFVLCVMASKEYLDLLASRDPQASGGPNGTPAGSTAPSRAYPDPWLVLAGSVSVLLANAIPIFWNTRLEPLGWPLAAFGLAVLAAFIGEMHRYERPGGVMEGLGLTVLGIAYCGLLLAFVVQMRLLGPDDATHRGAWGVAAIASLVIVVKMCDVGAYTFGRLFGRHKMTPVLSPGKTWEGATGGLVFACLGSWLALNWLTPSMTDLLPRPAWAWMAYGLVVGVAGIFGDLAESLIKRDVRRKDSSTWMPGFGGVLDVLDSVLFAAPVAFLLWKLGL